MEDHDKPRMVVLAGPNGSGKSTVTNGLKESEHFPKNYLNADVIAKELEQPVAAEKIDRYAHAIATAYKGKIPEETIAGQLREGLAGDNNTRNLYAATLAEDGRQQAVKGAEGFAFETVMSTPAKMGLFDEAKRNGFQVDLVFVTTESADINVARVGNRVEQGGHPVPEAAIRQRYERAMELLPAALERADTAAVFDNTGKTPMLVAQKVDGQIVFPELKKPESMGQKDFENMQQWVEDKIKGPLQAYDTSRKHLTEMAGQMPGATVAPADVTNGATYTGRIVGVTDKHVLQHIDGGSQFVLHDRASPLTPPSLQGVQGPSEQSVTTAYNFGVDGKFQQPQQQVQGLAHGQDLNADPKPKL